MWAPDNIKDLLPIAAISFRTAAIPHGIDHYGAWIVSRGMFSHFHIKISANYFNGIGVGNLHLTRCFKSLHNSSIMLRASDCAAWRCLFLVLGLGSFSSWNIVVFSSNMLIIIRNSLVRDVDIFISSNPVINSNDRTSWMPLYGCPYHNGPLSMLDCLK